MAQAGQNTIRVNWKVIFSKGVKAGKTWAKRYQVNPELGRKLSIRILEMYTESIMDHNEIFLNFQNDDNNQTEEIVKINQKAKDFAKILLDLIEPIKAKL